MGGIFINSDGWNFWGWGRKEDMNEAGLRKDVEFYAAQGGVEAVFYNLNYQRAFFPSRVFDRFADKEYPEPEKLDPAERHQLRTGSENFRELMKNCPDFIRMRYRICHENGIEMWHSMRMDDIHFTMSQHPEYMPLSHLWLERKDLIRAWYRRSWRKDPQDMTFDYARKEVRDLHLALAREYLLDYESDGLELDFLRALPLFRPGFDEMNTGLLTQFLRDIRAAAREAEAKWEHRIRIAVRVPFRVDEATGAGMDPAAWFREKLVDIVIPGPNNTGNETDPQLTVWRMLVPRDIILAPCIDYSIYARNGAAVPCEAVDCAQASSFYQLGADTVYLYNHFPCTETVFPRIREFFSYAGNRMEVAKRPRRHVALKHDPVGESRFIGPAHPGEIHPGCCNGGTKINAGEGTRGRRAEILICFSRKFEVDVLLNTVPCPLQAHPAPPPPEIPAEGLFFLRADVPEGVLHDGWNVVELYNRGTEIIYTVTDLCWMEIFIA